ncbi:MAG: 30S ribosomal protein S17 [Patescibacteria group bacterium]
MKQEALQKTHERAPRQFFGEVVAKGSPKTIRVRVETINTHPKYRKQYTTAKAYPVHDERGEGAVGDTVLFVECRPLSKTKRWRLIRIVKSKRI